MAEAEISIVSPDFHLLLAFRETGPGPKADALLAEALTYNPHVAALLLGRKRMPKAEPDDYSPGEASEAVVYVRDGAAAWASLAGALAWLRERAG